MEICDKFLCVNRKNKECHVPKNVVAFTCKHTNAPCPKARCEYCDVKECEKQNNGRIDRMSIINDQVKHLRNIANEEWTDWTEDIAKDRIRQAADTIESLSAKLQAANMERSAEDCGGWIPCSERMPEEHDSMFAKFKGTDKWDSAMFKKVSDDVNVTVEFENGKRKTKTLHTVDGKWNGGQRGVKFKVIAWQLLPEEYHG